MDTRQICATVTGRLIAQERYTYADHALVAAVVRETVAAVDELLCGELEDCVAVAKVAQEVVK